jgi:hypothetical protein
LKWVLNADPVKDARDAIRRDDFRFLAVKGFTISVPGIESHEQQLVKHYKYRVIEGTSDAVIDLEEREIQNKVIEYAAQYNRAILHHVKDTDR